MIKNYFKTAWRNLMKYKLYSFLNIAGLTVGILCSCLIFLYVTDELSYDNYNPLAERTYRINFFGKFGERAVSSAQSPAPAGPLFKREMPQVEEMCRLLPNGRSIVKYENTSFNESNVLFADSSLFRVFNFPLLQGNAATALTEPNTAVMSVTMAKKYFGISDAIGRTIKLDNDKLYKITAVMKDIPANTHFKCDMFLSMASVEDSRADNWGSTNYATYLVLKEGTNTEQFSKTMTQSFIKHFSAVLKQYLNTTWEEFTKSGNYARLELFPLQKIHLYSQLEDELDVNGDIKYVYIFSIVGILILALACINFINLTTARASKRAKEVGIRKVAGATRSGLARQFLGECFFISIQSWILALTLAWLLLPFFNQLAGKQFSAGNIFSWQFLPASFLITVVTGLLAGLYPALFLSSFTPVKVLKGAKEISQSKSLLRNGLVVFQFFITTVLLVSAFVVYKQLEYIRNKNLGFDKEQVLVVNDGYLLGNNVQAFKQRLLQLPSVSNVSVTNILAVSKDANNTSIIKGRNPSTENTVLVNNMWVDADFVKTMGIQIVQGRDVSKINVSDSTAVLINEELAKSFGYPSKPVIGQEIGLPQDEGKLSMYNIVGVMKDYNYGSLHSKIGPLVLFPNGSANFINVKCKTTQITSLISLLETAWKEMAPGQPFSYNFLDEKFAQIYETENRIGKITGVFTVIAIIIACMGLLGLVTFMAEQRRKEIGIRKVLGAGTFTITSLMAKDFIKLVLVSVVFAFPVAWYGMSKWLNDFAYRIEMQWWMFALIALAALVIALLTVSFQAIKAAVANPVKSLRTE